MLDEIKSRFEALIERGDTLVAQLPRDQHGLKYYARTDQTPTYQEWLSGGANLIRVVAPSDSHYVEQCERLLTDEHLRVGVPSHVVQRMVGLLRAAHADWQAGLLRKVEYMVAAATFDDFLDHAEAYHKGNKKTESAVLASAVLEDTIKKIAARAKLPTSGQSLEQLIDALVANSTLTLVKAKRVKGWAAVRNHALHAEWEKFDIRDVGELIKGVRELLSSYL